MANANFGTVQHNGKTLTLTQQAFLDCDGSNAGEKYYSAGAVDSDGNVYRVRWEIYEGFDGEDEGDACDWENPSRIELIESNDESNAGQTGSVKTFNLGIYFQREENCDWLYARTLSEAIKDYAQTCVNAFVEEFGPNASPSLDWTDFCWSPELCKFSEEVKKDLADAEELQSNIGLDLFREWFAKLAGFELSELLETA